MAIKTQAREEPRITRAEENHATRWLAEKEPFVLGVAGGLLLWLAFPPLAWSLFGWLAPLPWVYLILRHALPGRHPYRQLYWASLLTWLALLQWVRLPHWSAGFGWVALSLYLAAYLPCFVAVTRHITHRWRWPIVIAAPLVWSGLELARARLFTGFAMLLLGHSQVRQTTWIQIADLAGAYGVGFVMMTVAAALVAGLSSAERALRWKGAAWAAAMVAAVWAYGAWRIPQWTSPAPQDAATDDALNVGLIQGSIDTRFDDPSPPDMSYRTYLRLSQAALKSHPELQLLIWPESMYWQYEEPVPPFLTPQSDPERFYRTVAAMGGPTAKATASALGVPCLVGCLVWDYQDRRELRYNSLLSIAQDGTRLARYDKMHPVMFGEYVPLGNYFPWLYRLTPMPYGLTAGSAPACIHVGRLKFCPNICFENTVPHLIRRQVRALIHQGESPDALVTVTNDGWFWGSSLLDHHLACGVFRAVEMRRPVLIAANTGISAWIDGAGRVLEEGPRRADGLVVARVHPRRGPESPYLRWGDIAVALCLSVVCVALVDSSRPRNWHDRYKTHPSRH